MIMDIEKRRSKGSFLSLFDWNGKSRKKLFCDNPNSPVDLKQGKDSVENLPKSQFNKTKVDENGINSSNIATCDLNPALSIISDEGYGTRAPGLVARLMGLDSLPTSTVPELSSPTLYDSKSVRSSHCLDSMSGYHPMEYINTPLMLEKSSWDEMESRVHKVPKWPIKRFQTEMLPPKSAKPIPVTHNKLLSSIKSHGFVPPENAAYTMDAAVKIIQASPQPYMKNKMSSAGCSSIPLRILDLKEKLEAAQYAPTPEKIVDTTTVNTVIGKPSERGNNLYKFTRVSEGSRDLKKISLHLLGSKGKSVSLAIKAKASVQSTDKLISNGNRGYMQKKQNKIILNQFSRTQKPISHQATKQRTYRSRNSNVLRQINQKQNSTTNKGKSTSEEDSKKPTTRTHSSESSTGGARKTTNKDSVIANIGHKRSSRWATDTQKEFPLSKTRDVLNEARVPDNAVNNYESKSIKCNITTDRGVNQDALSKKESKDVISFTFTYPLRRESQSSTHTNSVDVDSLGHSNKLCPAKLSLSPPGLHMIDGDALSVLLERRLQELASRINSSQCPPATEGVSAGLPSSVQDKVPCVASTESRERDRSFNPDPHSDKMHSMHDNGCSSSDDLVLDISQRLQGSAAVEEPSCGSNSGTGNDQGLDAPFVSESFLDTEDGSHGSTVYSSMQDEEVSNFSPIIAQVKWSELSSCAPANRSNLIESNGSRNLVSNAELKEEDFVMGQTNPFDLLEDWSSERESNGKDYSELERKVLFDSVSEHLEFTCRQTFVGSYKTWQNEGWLAEDLYKEMLGLKSMQEVMVDEVVSKDMSTRYGRWLDFDIEAFEEGLEIEWDISTSLISELVSDLLLD